MAVEESSGISKGGLIHRKFRESEAFRLRLFNQILPKAYAGCLFLQRLKLDQISSVLAEVLNAPARRYFPSLPNCWALNNSKSLAFCGRYSGQGGLGASSLLNMRETNPQTLEIEPSLGIALCLPNALSNSPSLPAPFAAWSGAMPTVMFLSRLILSPSSQNPAGLGGIRYCSTPVVKGLVLISSGLRSLKEGWGKFLGMRRSIRINTLWGNS